MPILGKRCVRSLELKCVCVSQVSASGMFELRLKSFVNEYGKDSLGKCCSGSASRMGECSGVCKTRFRVCLKQYQVKIDTTSPCTYGDVVTPVLGENVVNLSTSAALPSFTNPIRFPFEFTWPVSRLFDIFYVSFNPAEKFIVFSKSTSKDKRHIFIIVELIRIFE